MPSLVKARVCVIHSVVLFFRGCVFFLFLGRDHLMSGVDCHTHAAQCSVGKILVSLHQFLASCVEKWNKKVHAHDEVVILGDFSLGNGQETNQILRRLKGKLYLIRGNHDDRYLKDKDFDVSRFVWIEDYAEIHDNKRKIVLMHYPIFCYNGQFRRRADGIPLTYMLHGHIHKSEDQVLVDKFCAETRATMRKSAHQEKAQPIPCQMINCFCMYSDYTPLTLEEWVECDQWRRGRTDRDNTVQCALDIGSDDFMSDGRVQ